MVPGVSGVIASASVDYWLNGDSTTIQTLPLIMTPGVVTGGPGGSQPFEEWSAQLPAQPTGTTVTWWIEAHDVCHADTDYFSDGGQNYAYTTL
jgi:hypothetical protein